jgi:predicted SprT family Zn-dependent metalloprotease
MFLVLAKKDRATSIKKQIDTISKIKNFLKKDEVVKEIFDKYNKSMDDMDGIAISFEKDLDVTAKTIDGKIILNTSLMDENFNIICRYVVHELTHVFQHIEKEFSKKQKKEKEYLDRPEEIEAFQNQVKFDSKKRSRKEAIKYIEDLLNYHKIKKEKKEEKKRQLLDKLE